MKSSWSEKMRVSPFVAGMLFLVATAGAAKDSFAPIAGHAGSKRGGDPSFFSFTEIFAR